MAIIITNPIKAPGVGSGSMAIVEKDIPRAWSYGVKGNGAGSIHGTGYGNGNMALYPIQDRNCDESKMDQLDIQMLYSIIDEEDELDGSGWGDFRDGTGYGCGFGERSNELLADKGYMFGEPIMSEYMDIDGYDNWNEEFHLKLQITDEKLFQ